MSIDFSHFDKGDYEFAIILIVFIGVAYKFYFRRVLMKNGTKGLMSKEEHAAICKSNLKDLKDDYFEPRLRNMADNIETIMNDTKEFRDRFYDYMIKNGR